MNEEDLKFYNKQDKEELVIMCISRDNMLNKVEQENKALKERIDEAIEVIEEVLESWEKEKEYHLGLNIAGLLEILKGEE